MSGLSGSLEVSSKAQWQTTITNNRFDFRGSEKSTASPRKTSVVVNTAFAV
jgi:hypothetical protein